MKTCPLCKEKSVKNTFFVPIMEIGNKKFSLRPREILKCQACNEEIWDLITLMKIDVEFCSLILEETLDGPSFLFCSKALRFSRKEIASKLGISEDTVKYMQKTDKELPQEINIFLKERLKTEEKRDYEKDQKALVKHLTSLISEAEKEMVTKKLKIN